MSGDLKWFQPDSEATFVRLIGNDNITAGKNSMLWGEAACAAPSVLSPHGIHLSERENTLQLLVVNHSATEQVLFYEVIASADTDTPPILEWRGCVEFPEHAVLNSEGPGRGRGARPIVIPE